MEATFAIEDRQNWAGPNLECPSIHRQGRDVVAGGVDHKSLTGALQVGRVSGDESLGGNIANWSKDGE